MCLTAPTKTKVKDSGSRTATMRGWAIDAYGGPEAMRLQELPMPEPEPRDMLIRMHAAEVGDWDALVRDGEWPMERPFPLVLGLAGAGTVAAVGSNVSGFAVGGAVYAHNYPMRHKGCGSPDHNGAWAEYMLVPVSYVARAPDALDLTQAGALPIVGLTAHETLTDILEVRKGDVVLITAAAGGVGHLAVQIAAHLGAQVIATASNRNHDFVRALGAETAIDCTTEDLVAAIRARYPDGVDKALNGVAGETANQIVQTLRDGGRMVDLTQSASLVRPGVQVNTDYVVQADAERLARLTAMIDDRQLTVALHQVFPFDKAPEALELVRAKHVRGKVVLKIA